MSSDRHHQSDSLASLWVCRDRVLNLVIYEIVFHIYFVKFFFWDLCFSFWSFILWVAEATAASLRGIQIGLQFRKGGRGIGFRWLGTPGDGVQCNPRKCYAAFVEHAQLQDAALGFVLLQLYKVFQPFSLLFFPFLFFFCLGRGDSCHSINGSSIWSSLSQKIPPIWRTSRKVRPALWHAIFTQTFQ